MSQLTFRVSEVSKKKRQVPQNQYTDSVEGDEAWRVSLKCDQAPDRYMDLWYQEEADARKFPERHSLNIGEVFGNMGTLSVELRVREISKQKKFLGINQYTDRPKYQDAWMASLTNDGLSGGMMQADLYYPNQQEANMWSFAQVYSPMDLMRVFKILVHFYPAAVYDETFDAEGFWDINGYHQPGVYPAGYYPAGFYTGHVVDLGKIDGPSLAVEGWVLASVR